MSDYMLGNRRRSTDRPLVYQQFQHEIKEEGIGIVEKEQIKEGIAPLLNQAFAILAQFERKRSDC
jgi:hypothetical protein